MIKKLLPGIGLVLAAGAFGFAVRDQLPARVASHWGVNGEVNGWSSRTFLLLFMPGLALFTAVLLAVAPTLDPKRRNFPMHAGAYWIITNALLAFLAATHVMVIGYNLGWKINISMVIGVGLGLLFVVLGNLLTRVRPNWIIGIRTPWTLSSDRAWRETHRVGGYTFVLAGLATLVSALLWPQRVPVVMAVSAGFTAIFSVAYSYFAWKRDPDALGRNA